MFSLQFSMICVQLHSCDLDGCSNYCQEFDVYLGKESTQPSKNGAIFDVVWNLLKDIQGKNHVVYFDNLFSSVVTA